MSCRSATRPPWRLDPFSNRLLIAGVAFGLRFGLAALFVGPVAKQLGQLAPPVAGWAVAIAAAPVLLVVDALHKRWRSSDLARTDEPAQLLAPPGPVASFTLMCRPSVRIHPTADTT